MDGKIPISNNQAENAIRPFAVWRRVWLFADTPEGAESSAIAYSIVETAKANKLNIF
ncbi:IS66 family transposase [Clostridium saccharoperbutylacetonicum]|uniref:IS66 family transposase n=1 Tax=Clostridium saccharoperbutylacetonicum TaxID=36745 RepID=UPI0039EAB756